MNYTNNSIDDENDDESREISAADSSTTARIATDTTCRNNNNNNPNGSGSNGDVAILPANKNQNGGGSNRNNDGDKNWDTINHVAQIKIKKEEIKEDIMDDNNNNACLANKNNIDDDYADWKTGSWCWLLPSTGNDNDKDKGDTNNRKRKSKQCKSLRDNNINEDEGSDVNYGDLAAGNNASIMNDDDEEEEEEEPAKKKIRIKGNEEEADTAAVNNSRNNKDGDGYESWTKGNWCWLLPSSRSIEEKRLKSDNNTVQINSSNNNNKDDDDEELGIKQDGNNGNDGHREEVIIGHDVDNDNDNDNDNNSYESWTVGNWCWILPPSSDDVMIEATEEHRRSNAVPAINETTNRLVRSSPRRRYSSSSALLLDVDDEYDDGDGNKDNDDDFENNNNTKRIHSKKGKYTRLQNEIWHEMFQRLIAYKKQHDSTNVSSSYKADKKLASWVHSQRICYRKNELSEERINYLESIGFVWKIYEKLPWDEMFQRLVTYKKKFKSTLVPQRYSSDQYLGKWVNSQRTSYNSEKLSVKRINLLESIGFVWDPFDEQWMEMYHKLVTYKKQNRSTKVPCHYTEDPQLGTWVGRQRQVYNSTKPGGLTEKRLELLNSINFAWSGR
jgi:hypothetical protein